MTVRWELTPDVICEEIQGVYVLMSAQKKGNILPFVQELNEYGAFCWKILEQEQDFNKVVRTIADRYGMDEKTVLVGLLSFMKELQINNYLCLHGVPEIIAEGGIGEER